jgi:hypothetical protein
MAEELVQTHLIQMRAVRADGLNLFRIIAFITLAVRERTTIHNLPSPSL